MVNCTLTLNSTAGSGGGEEASGVYNRGGVVSLANTIVAGNHRPINCCGVDLFGDFQSGGYNLIGDDRQATGFSVFDFLNIDAKLGPLQDNGGPTWTCLLQPGSPAIGSAGLAAAPTVDQRRVHRSSSKIDLGATQRVTDTPVFMLTMSAGGVELQTIFDSAKGYVVRTSTDLVSWGDVTNYTGGSIHSYNDGSTSNVSHRFYRATVP
ncbi:MAG TPA: choice-of-anchor Q domain-containing protein [Verrucomicrobiae bacterium]|nr:choice-of-anchor Q domain-containing protein [Verrucomicrobiae bacterium]